MADGENEEKKQGTSFTNAFKQQVMRAWQPVPTIKSIIYLFFILTIFFLTFGFILLSYSNQIIEYSIQYDKKCQDKLQEDWVLNDPDNNFNPLNLCTLDLKITEDIDGPVYVYYELDNFYQNHRRYVKSRSVDQLQGEDLNKDDIDDACSPITTNEDAGQKFSYGGTPLDPKDQVIPCGLIANSFFTDNFFLREENADVGNYIEIGQQDIAWPSDKEHKFKNTPDSKNKAWIDVEKNERFIVWMRTAALPYFRKLWGRIDQDLPKGEYKIDIQNLFDVSKFDGKKYIVLSTANAFGGKNMFLAISYIVVGAICFIITVGFTIKHFMHKKQKPE